MFVFYETRNFVQYQMLHLSMSVLVVLLVSCLNWMGNRYSTIEMTESLFEIYSNVFNNGPIFRMGNLQGCYQ